MQVYILGAILLSCGLASADSSEEVHMNFTVTSRFERFDENIDINYRRKFVKVTTPSHEGLDQTELLHDYNQGHNVLKKNGRCLILHDFEGIPENIKDWDRLQPDGESEVPSQENLKLFNYKVLPYPIDRTPFPETIKEFCPGEIRVLILQTVLDGQEAQEMDDERVAMSENPEPPVDTGDNPEPRGEMSDDGEEIEGEDFAEIFIPNLNPRQSRVKRAWRVFLIRQNGRWRLVIRWYW